MNVSQTVDVQILGAWTEAQQFTVTLASLVPSPALASDSIATAPAPLAFSSQLTVWIPGRGGNGKVSYAGAAPGLAAGVTQINFQIPYGAAVGLVPVQLLYPTLPDLAESQLGVYFCVK